jgi:hypothetical protein
MSSAYKEKIEAVPLFVSFNPPLRTQLADILIDIGKVRVLKKGEQLYAEGAVDDNTGAIVLDGDLIVAFGTHQPVFVKAPELVGEMQQFNKYGTRTATVCAKDPTTVLEFAWHDFVARVQDRPEIGHADQLAVRNAFTKFAGDRFKERKK